MSTEILCPVCSEPVVVPMCPDCGTPCEHPLTMPVPCPSCDGGKDWCLDCDALANEHSSDDYPGFHACESCGGVGSVRPSPSLEQIVGRKCTRCGGTGNCPGGDGCEEFGGGPCVSCSATGWETRPVENKWICRGVSTYVCSCDAEDGHEKVHPKRVICPGRTDVIADAEIWASWRQVLLTRSQGNYDEEDR